MRRLATQLLAPVIFSLACALGCALYNPTGEAPVTKTCAVPADQSGTIEGHWLASPIPLAFHTGDWDAVELNAMTAAADTWNTFFTASKSLEIFNYGGSGSATTTSGADPASNSLCGQAIYENGAFSGAVGIYKISNGWSYGNSIIALTSYCTAAAPTYPLIYMAVMEINYENFFTTNRVPDLQTIVTHELGHLLGIGHSCSTTGQSGYPNCNEAGITPAYLTAVMIPAFSFTTSGIGQRVRVINSDDESRANCLY